MGVLSGGDPASNPPSPSGPAGPTPSGQPGAGSEDVRRALGRALWELLRRRPLAAIPYLGIVVSLVAFAVAFVGFVRLGGTVGGLLADAGQIAWTVGVLYAATWSLRTIRLRDVIRAWLLGFFVVMLVVEVVGLGVTALVPPGDLRTAVLVPILEEVLRTAPLGLFLWLAATGRMRELGAVDITILGMLIGAGFGYHENALYVRPVGDGFSASFWGVLFPALPLSWNVVGHLGWSAMIAGAIGVAWRLRHITWIVAVPLLALAVGVLDHAANNALGAMRDPLQALILGGVVTPWLMLAAIVAAIAVDTLTLRDRRAVPPLPERLRITGLLATLRCYPERGMRGLIVRTLGAVLLIAERRQLTAVRYRRHGAAVAAPAPAAGQP